MTAAYAALGVIVGCLGVFIALAWWADAALERRHRAECARIASEYETSAYRHHYRNRDAA